ncbi:hypothetical protein R1flu_026014 [Riccia fluitans]|uniref:Uncharacterized protein n=1 Tax=Riccia fluitans TaxID=41844 RepID=A0ABD1XHQ9_9MARC
MLLGGDVLLPGKLLPLVKELSTGEGKTGSHGDGDHPSPRNPSQGENKGSSAGDGGTRAGEGATLPTGPSTWNWVAIHLQAFVVPR